MIVDCHTHIWQSPSQLGQLDLGDLSRSAGRRSPRIAPSGKSQWRALPAGDPDHHWAESAVVDKSIVLGFKSKYLRAEIPNAYVAEYVNRFPKKLIGFAGIDPTERSAIDELRAARDHLQLRGMPVLIHPVGQFTEQSKLEFARPAHFDEVARTFPKLRIVIAQLGQPWIEETICLLGKHENVFADVSGLLSRPWLAYNALVAAHESQVIEKLLFGSDFPYTSITECIEALYSINQLAQGTNMPVVPREALRGIVERDALGLLGIG